MLKTFEIKIKVQGHIASLNHRDPAVKISAIEALRDCSNAECVIESGAMGSLVNLLENSSSHIKNTVLCTLDGLITWAKSSHEALLQAGGLACLIKLLHDSNISTKKMATHTLFQFMCRSQGSLTASVKYQALKEANGLVILTRLMNDRDPEIISNAAGALACLGLPLSSESRTLALLIQEDIIGLAIRVCNMQDGFAISYGCGILSNLSVDESCRSLIRDAGGIPLLVSFISIRVTRDGIINSAAAALINLALSEECRDAICEAGGIDALVEICARELRDVRPNLDCCIVISALQTLISESKKNRLYFLERDGFTILEKIANTHRHQRVREHAQEFITNFQKKQTNNSKNKVEFEHARGIEPLVELLHDEDPIVREKAVAELKNLVKNTKNHAAIVRAGGALSLIQLSSARCSSQMLNEIMTILETLFQDSSSNQTAIVEAGGIPVFVRLLENSKSGVRSSACVMLAELVIRNKNNDRFAIMQANSVPSFIRLINDDNANTRANAIGALATLLENPANQRAIIQAGGIAPLLACVSDTFDIRKHAVLLLHNAVKNSKNDAVAIVQAGVLPPLTCFLSDADSTVRQYAVSTIAILTKTQQVNDALMRANCISPLVSLLSEVNTETCASAAIALWDLGEKAEGKISIASAGAIPPLVHLLSDDDPGMRERALGAVWVLAMNRENRIAIEQAGGIPPLVRLLKDAGPLLRKLAAETLHELAKDNMENQRLIRDSNAIPLLQRLVKTVEDPKTVKHIKKTIEACDWQSESEDEHEDDEDDVAIVAKIKPHAHQNSEKSSAKSTSVFNMEKNFSRLGVEPSVAPTSNLESIPFHQLTTLRELGRGGFGIVYEGLWQGVKVAIKKSASSSLPQDVLNEFMREAELHARLRHPNIVTLYGVCLEPAKYAMVMELMHNDSLYKLLHSEVALPWSQRINIALEMTAGLLFLHSKNILHRDLKSMNVLLDDRGCAKISDFGLSKVKTHIASSTTGNSVGSLYWKAPELFKINGKCSTASDIYALGITFWEIASRTLPYQAASGDADLVRGWVKDGEREEIPAGTPPQFGMLIRRCWAQRAEDRPAIEKVAQTMRDSHFGDNSMPQNPRPAVKASVVDSGFEYSGKRI